MLKDNYKSINTVRKLLELYYKFLLREKRCTFRPIIVDQRDNELHFYDDLGMLQY